MEILDEKELKAKKRTKYILIAVSVIFIVFLLVLPLISIVVNSLKKGLDFQRSLDRVCFVFSRCNAAGNGD